MALRTRRRSTCRRTTSSGSVTVIAAALHATTLNVQSMSGMWTVRSVTSVGMTVATCGVQPLFPLHLVLGVVLGVVLDGPRGTTGAVSALPDPAERRLGRGLRRGLMLAVAPGAAGALLMVALPARDADHALLCGFRAVLVPGTAKRLRPYQRCSRSASGCSRLAQPGPGSCEQDLRRRSRAACDGGARPNAHPRSGRPRCRTFPAARRRSSGIQAAPGKQRRLPWPCAP